MKLTKTKLKEIIREELQMLNERFDWDYATLEKDGRLRDDNYDKIIKDATKIFHKALGKLSKIN